MTDCSSEAATQETSITAESPETKGGYACVAALDTRGNRSPFAASTEPVVVDLSPPAVDVGPARAAGQSFTIRPHVTDVSSLTYLWEKVSGPGSVTFENPTAKDTLMSASVDGVYELQLTVTDQANRVSKARFRLTWDRSLALAVGWNNTCAIYPRGELRCWGRNNSGPLGIGTKGESISAPPVQAIAVGDQRSVLSVQIGGYTICAVLDDGSAKCWGWPGAAGYGPRSDEILSPRMEPLNLGPGRKAQAVATGLNHACALLANGEVTCWGDNAFGQLGYGDTLTRPEVADAVVNLGAGRTARQIVAGDHFTCALLDNGQVKCWGRNHQGQLGVGTTTTMIEPPAEPITFPGGLTAKQISVGPLHACAILTDHSVACWGNNWYGQLGDRTVVGRLAPVAVSDLNGLVPTRITAGTGATCVVLDDGSARCWGGISAGEIGTGRRQFFADCSDGKSSVAAACTAGGSVWSSAVRDCSNGISTGPEACAALGGAWAHCSDYTKATSAACTGALAWDPSKHAYCTNTAGTQNAALFCATSGGTLGYMGYCSDDAYLSRAACLQAAKTWHLSRSPGPPLPFGPNKTVITVALGNSLGWGCALLSDSAIRCWGGNYYGQLGYGDSSFTARFSAPLGFASRKSILKTAHSATHSCALAQDGGVSCWGANDYGQLGDGTFQDRSTPPLSNVSLPSAAVDVVAHYGNTCALLFGGTIHCWGDNVQGQLGGLSPNGGASNVPAPIQALGGDATDIAIGQSFMCAIVTGGQVKCWGTHTLGQLGVGITTVATYCSDGTTTTQSACTASSKTWNVSLYGDCSSGISTSPSACQAVTDGTWAHCSDGIKGTQAACSGGSLVWDPSKFAYCTHAAGTKSATTFCTENGGVMGNYGYCSNPDLKSRIECHASGASWHVRTLPGDLVDLGGTPAVQVAAGRIAACALLANGTVRCWGKNTYGVIGIGDSDESAIYASPATPINFGGQVAKRVSASSDHFCAVLANDSLSCWGFNGWGALNTGTLSADRKVRSLALTSQGSENTCVITDDLTVRCSGRNFGDMTPIDLGTSTAPASIALGSFGAFCVTFVDGTVRCAGHNNRGQTGVGDPITRLRPPEVTGITLSN